MIKNTVFLILLLQYVQSQSTERISETKCREYSNQCKVVDSDVTDETAKPGEFPHMVILGIRSENTSEYKWVCGGSLISENFVLSAAHCFWSRRLQPNVIRLGAYNISDNESNTHDIQIDEVIRHPNYKDSDRLYNNIILVKLKTPASFNDKVRPVCLSQDDNVTVSHAFATGWGEDTMTGKFSQILKKIYLPIISNDECTLVYDKSFKKGIVQEQLCAGGEAGKDTCRGDGGGPLQLIDDVNRCSYREIGIISTGPQICGKKGFPGIYTRISSYIDWIESVVWA